MLYLLLITYGAILLAEIVGDKNIYTISSLATRFRPSYVFCGFTIAFSIKMLVAVMLGDVIAGLPRYFVAFISTATFFLTAVAIWFKRSEDETNEREPESRFSKGALITLAAILFSEWADVGQIMAATLTARYQAPFVVWLGATLAMMTKGVFALLAGRSLRRYVPISILRPASAGLCVVLGVISALAPIFERQITH